jgi:hypothetical protein
MAKTSVVLGKAPSPSTGAMPINDFQKTPTTIQLTFSRAQ